MATDRPRVLCAARILALCLATLAPQAAAAQTPSPSTAIAEARAAARELAERGFQLLQEKKFNDAIATLEQAEAKFHAPPHLLYMARARAGLGQLAQARSLYLRVIEEQLASYAPDAFRDAQAVAKTELAALGPRVPALEVVAPEGWKVTVDGRAVSPAELLRPIFLDPGDHDLRATFEGAADFTRSVHLEAAGRTRIEIVPAPQGAETKAPPPIAPLAAPPPPVATPPPVQPARADSQMSLAPAVAAFVVGAAGLGVGAVTGALSLSDVNDLASRCPSNHCMPQDRGTANSATTLGNVSTGTFVAGGVGVAVGVVLLIVRGTTARPASTGKSRPTLMPTIGRGTIGLQGSF